jgi:hypothetical protein
MALGFFDVFTLLSSNHYLASTSQVPGLIYGALWGLSRSFEENLAGSSRGKIIIIKQKSTNTMAVMA